MAKSKVKLTRKPVNGGLESVRVAAKHGAIKVGVLRGQGEHPKGDHGQTVAEIAFWNEFGTVRIPARPFMRSTLKEQRKTYQQFLKMSLKKILTLKLKHEKALKMLGLMVSTDIKEKITSLSSPANSPNTLFPIGRKKSSNPLIDTGTLRRSINWVKI